MKMQQIKIAHIVEGFTGGLASYMCNVLPQLAKKGFNVSLICSLNRSCPDAEEKIERLRQKGVNVHIISMQRSISPIRDFCSFLILLKLFTHNNFDIIHTHCSKAGFLGRITGFLCGIKVRVHSSHCFAFLRCGNFITKWLYFIPEKILALITTRYAAVSESEIKIAIYKKLYPLEKCVVINNGLDLQHFSTVRNNSTRKKLNIPDNCPIITTACRFIEYKRLFLLIDAARLVKTNCVFLIAGDGKLRKKIEVYISINNLSKKVLLTGYLSEIESLYAISDVAVLCSTAEGQPYSILEAMKNRCPMIATNVIGNTELLENNRGLLIESNPVQLSKSIDKLLTNNLLKNQIVEKAYRYINKEHDLTKQIETLVRNYKPNLDKNQDVNSHGQ